MGQKRYTPEQIIGKLRQAEVRSAKGATVAEIVRELGITEQTYYRWRKEYGGLKVAQAKRLPLLGAGQDDRALHPYLIMSQPQRNCNVGSG
jgi:transposase-like protein